MSKEEISPIKQLWENESQTVMFVERRRCDDGLRQAWTMMRWLILALTSAN